ncbi:hypothetical protein TA5114_02102 [Cognatishimia activa]|uniref:Uncharacterized protein n=1 Tax=Cognatishimia activa TaxID=1715691 RepID=A0A0P1IS61_9RHOB|nr:hypothetical protein TA5113_00930 [Cognatishimia activa]CUK26293.1 hypothetical protein TA5114_02102 [Cognatishimia activa]
MRACALERVIADGVGDGKWGEVDGEFQGFFFRG